ncbi:hypothetical protein ACHAWF_001589 [Thalassiosira exigua]
MREVELAMERRLGGEPPDRPTHRFSQRENVSCSGSASASPAGSPSAPASFSMPGDVYSLLCLSSARSRPFLYALFIASAKFLFYALVLWEIFHKSIVFPKSIPEIVRVTQLVMLPVTVIVTDEGVLAALFVYRHLIYEEKMAEIHPLMTEFRYRGCNLIRFVDAIVYQTVVFFVLMQAEEVLDVFLNFAALRFLMEIDTVAFTVAAHGYLTEELYKAAQEVSSVRLRGGDSEFRQRTAQAFFAFSLGAMVVTWVLVQYVLA